MYSEPSDSTRWSTGSPSLVQLISGIGSPPTVTCNVVGWPADVLTSSSLVLINGTNVKQY